MRRQRLPRISIAVLTTVGVIVPCVTQAQVAFEDVSAPAGFAGSATETWGASWGDYDGDGYPDLFVGNHRARAALYRNNRNGTFTNVSKTVDFSRTPGWTGGRANVDTHGATWGDVDNDGDQDLYESVSVGDDNLFINDGGVLTNRKLDYGLDDLAHYGTRQNLFVDYNGDGLLDLASIALSNPSFAPQLVNAKFGHGSGVEIRLSCSNDAQWAHLADVHSATPGLELLCAPRTQAYPKSVNAFVDGSIVDVSAGFPTFGPVNDAVTLDYNRDLLPDILIVRGSERPSDAYQSAPEKLEIQFITAANKAKSVRFRSPGGTLTISASLRAGENPEGNPNYIDIGAMRWSPTSLTFDLSPVDPRNAGIGTGSEGINIGYHPSSDEWQITQGDRRYAYSYVKVQSTAPITDVIYDGQSASDKGLKPVLLKQTPDGFVQSTTAGFNVAVRCQSAAAGDFDNDMDEDVFLACTGGAHNVADRLFLNNGAGKFIEVPNAAGAAGIVGAAVEQQAGSGESVITADYDLDGFLDLFVTNGNNMRPLYVGGPKQLFRNTGNSNRWIEFDLVGTTSNRDATGSQVYVSAGGIMQYREQNGGYHRWSQNSRRIHVGLGSNTSADVNIRWPDGSTTQHAALESNRIYRLSQDGSVTTLTLP